MVLGSVFLGIKVIEYADKFEHHHVPGAELRAGRGARAGWGRVGRRRGCRRAARSRHHGARCQSADAHADLLQPLLHDDRAARAAHDHRRRADVGDHVDGVEGASSTAEDYTPVEMSGLYWHFVDIVWIFLFPLLYLIDRS